jgi:hypothetical protein
VVSDTALRHRLRHVMEDGPLLVTVAVWAAAYAAILAFD